MKKIRKASVLYQYIFTNLIAILVASSILATILLSFSAKEITESEVRAYESGLELIVNDIETQYSILESITAKVQITPYYRPKILALSRYNDQILLDNFKMFRTYSPICSRYFLLYQDNPLIFTSDGATSIFAYYMTANFSIGNAESGSLFETLNSQERFTILSLPNSCESLLFVYPIRFYSSTAVDSAVVVFEIQKTTLIERLEKISGNFPQTYSIRYNGDSILSSDDFNHSTQDYLIESDENSIVGSFNDRKFLLAARSESEKFEIFAEAKTTLLRDTFFRNQNWLIFIIALVITLFIVIAVIFAYVNFKPIRKLKNTFGKSEGSSNKNELQYVEKLLHELEDKNKNSLDRIKEQLLLMIINGDYSKELLERWSFFGINFNESYNCAFVISRKDMNSESIDKLTRQINEYMDEDISLYSVYVPKDDVIAIIANFRYNYLSNDIFEFLQALGSVDKNTVSVFAGQNYKTAHKIALSYQEAVSFYKSNDSQSLDIMVKKFSDDSQYMLEGIISAIDEKNITKYTIISDKIYTYVMQKASSLLYQKYICYDMISSIIRYAEKNGYEHMKYKTSRLLLVGNFDVFMNDLNEIVYEIINLSESSEYSNQERENKMIAFIEENAHDCDFSLDDMQDEFSLNAHYIGQLIKNHTGLTFKEYLTKIRMQRSKKLLLSQSELTIKDIGTMVGYRTPSNFIRKFKEVTGSTPLSYRELKEND
jgi:two-component system response regulator YesN